MTKACLFTDGGSRGNPGPAGLGFHLVDNGGEDLALGGWFLGRATNNVAEYAALVWGLRNALELGVDSVAVQADSELMVKQMNGAYKVRSEDLKPLFLEAKSLFSRFAEATISHVYRADNAQADKMANAAMDAAGPVGSFAVPWEGGGASLFPGEPEGLVPEGRLPMNDMPVEGGTKMEMNSPYTGEFRLSGKTYESVVGHYELTVKDHFDAAHTLPGYDGPCRYLHGHTWDVEVTIAGQHLDSVGILFDFKDIKRMLHGILENFDHRYINDTPPFDVINPTAEHLARVVYYELEERLPAGISLKDVAIWESPQAKLVYRP